MQTGKWGSPRGAPGLGVVSLLLFVFVTTACRRENVSVPAIPADSAAFFAATINGVKWQTDSVSAFLVNQFREQVKIMTITGYSANRVITISLMDTPPYTNSDSAPDLRQYEINSWGSTAAFDYAYDRIAARRDSVWQQQGTGMMGQASVTASDAVNKKVTGNFQFKANVIVVDSPGLTIDSVTVTNGMFRNIPYVYFRQP